MVLVNILTVLMSFYFLCKLLWGLTVESCIIWGKRLNIVVLDFSLVNLEVAEAR